MGELLDEDMNIQDNELSVVVPKQRWHQMEQELTDAEQLIENLLQPSDNIVIVKVWQTQASIMNRRYRFETVHFNKFEVEGGGEIIQSMLKTKERDCEELLKRLKRYGHMEETTHNKIDETFFKDKIKALEGKVLQKEQVIKRLKWELYISVVGLLIAMVCAI